MTTFVLVFFSRTPPWVWLILAALVVLGPLQSRDPVVSRASAGAAAGASARTT